MAVPLPQGPEENWDDDFEFNQRNSRGDGGLPEGARPEPTTPLSKDRKNTLKRWTEPGPSTPSKRSSEQPENWDDDFRDSTDSPARGRSRVPHVDSGQHENWDEDFDDGGGGRSPKGKARWGSSDDEDEFGFAASEEDKTVTSRTRGMPLHFGDVPPPVPPLPSPLPHSPTPSVFSMPVSSNGHRDSTAYSTTSHIHLLSTGNSALAHLPPSPPIHRERRRLRKKSRPPANATPGMYELEELPDDLGQALIQAPTTPEKRASLSLEEPPPEAPPPITPGPSSGSNKTPLLSRIGSVGKKWGAGRKKRASTGPTEIALQEHHTERERDRGRDPERERELVSRPQSVASIIPSSPPASSHPKGSWFFRGGGGGGPGPPPPAPITLEHKTSVDRLLAMAGIERTPPTSPRKGKAPFKDLNADNTGSIRLTDGSTVSSSALFFGTPKRKPSRPMSVQAPQLHPSSSQGSSSGSSWSSRPPVPRHSSYGYDLGRRSATPSSRGSSKQRSTSASVASASVEDVSRSDRSLTVREGRRLRGQHRQYATDSQRQSETESVEQDPTKAKEGSRSFMGGMRRISLGGSSKHKRTSSKMPDREEQARKSSGAATIRAEREPAEETTPRPPSRVIRTSQDAPLLPPIELQPPSPPRECKRDVPDLSKLFRSHLGLEPSRSHPALSSSRSATPLASRPSGEVVPSMSPIPSPLPSPTKPKLASSPGQAASLGRATQPLKELETVGVGSVPRRNSLGDLKIPARISQAQVGLRRDLGMVREFAASIEQLKQLQQTYRSLVGEIQSVMYGEHPPDMHSRALTPTFFGLSRPSSRARSNTNPAPSPVPQTPHELILAFHSIESKYQISWECAELLIELGSGAPPHPSSAPTSPPHDPAATSAAAVVSEGRKGRERAVTLAGDEPKPIIVAPGTVSSPPLASPPSTAHWRASTGRHDLSSRQLILLREMLNNPDSSVTMDSRLPIPEEDWNSAAVNRTWHWGDPLGSTITLPSENGTQASGSGASAAAVAAKKQKRRSSKLGMRGIRDMLKSLKKSYAENPPTSLSPVPTSTISVSASTESSVHNVTTESWHQSLVQRRRAKTSTGPESMKSIREHDRHPNSPYATSMSLHRSSPRRPSLASIFRIGQKNRSNAGNNEQSSDDLGSSNPSSATSGGPTGLTEEGEEDWDQVESAFDLERTARMLEGSTAPDTTGTATVRGRLKKDRGKSPPEPSPRRSASALPPPSILASPTSRLKQLTGSRKPRPPSRGNERSTTAGPSPSPSSRQPSNGSRQPAHKGGQTGSVRSAPPQGITSPDPGLDLSGLGDLKLAMTPENIRPLLENAREVHARCGECIVELRALLATSVLLFGSAPSEAPSRATSPIARNP
ncbi:uncharacterized protein B0H18DRAFT_1047727 [Fomitopsis serialis]|uniref:uncharacterized protein n=1 Tax=Fomitopsis serialis TaxID=139415 RepID=UPI0020084BAD|nr:uncharacterized protein B0H18DRAFT_1047727 [Neoantrodia serialis]KAH9913710.1 hypothetical protein B0H18DRAFT_1047727 [Neoantrodia serialis]